MLLATSDHLRWEIWLRIITPWAWAWEGLAGARRGQVKEIPLAAKTKTKEEQGERGLEVSETAMGYRKLIP